MDEGGTFSAVTVLGRADFFLNKFLILGYNPANAFGLGSYT
jgi:hypothetical protein